jgi:monoamine oxidase
MSKYDVAVIGAGAAGLSAARALSGAGRSVCVIEARSRVGGRVHSLHLPDVSVPVELGAEFVHGGTASTLSLVGAASIPIAELPDNHWWARGGRWQQAPDFWGEIQRILGKISARRRDTSFAEFLRTRRDLTPRQRELARSFVEGYHAAHADRISASALRSADGEQEAEGRGNRQFRLAAGQDALISWLRAGLDAEHSELRLGTVAKSVSWSKGNVAIECRSRSTGRTEKIRASKLVVTLPIGVWKAPQGQEGAIRFDPPLPSKDRAVASLEAGHVVKIAFHFREQFWDDTAFLRERTGRSSLAPLNFLHASDPFVPTWWTTAPFRTPLLIGWAGGHAADALLAEGEETVADRALDSLSRAWMVPRRRLDTLLAGTYMHNWQSDPFSRCAYSYAGVGGSAAHAALARPVEETLFFAGEATSGEETGTVAGAIESGQRAAREVERTRTHRSPAKR